MALGGLRGTRRRRKGRKGMGTCPGAKTVLRAVPLGERGLFRSPRPPQANTRNCRVSKAPRLQVPGARPGLYRSPWKVVLEEASWSGRGVKGGGLSTAAGTSLLQTLFLSSKRQSCPLPGGGAAGAGWRGSGLDWAAPRCPSGSVLVLLFVGLVLLVDAVCRTGIADGLGLIGAAPHGLHEPLHLLSLVQCVPQRVLRAY